MANGSGGLRSSCAGISARRSVSCLATMLSYRNVRCAFHTATPPAANTKARIVALSSVICQRIGSVWRMERMLASQSIADATDSADELAIGVGQLRPQRADMNFDQIGIGHVV